MKRYSMYKDSGISWAGDIPSHWTTKRIKTLPDINIPDSFIDGDWIESPNISDSGIRYLTTGNIGDGTFKQQGNGFVSPETFERLNCKYAYPGDLVISRLNAPYGRACILPDDYPEYVLAVDNVILRTKENKKYLCYVMQCDGYQSAVEDVAKGTTMKRISRTNLGTIRLVIPPLVEQTAIANYLDSKVSHIDRIIAEARASIEEYKSWKASIIYEAVTKGLDKNAEMKDSGVEWIGEIPITWEVIPFTKGIDSIVDYRGKTPEKTTDGVFLVTARNIKDGKINYSLSAEYVNPAEYEEIMHRGKPEIGDVLFTTEAPLGEVANVDRTGFALAQRVIKFRCNPQMLDNYFLKYWIMSQGFQQNLYTFATGSTAKGIKASKLGQLKVVMPSIEEQLMIVSYLDNKWEAINSLIAEKESLISDLEAYKKSLIFEVVTGKRKVV